MRELSSVVENLRLVQRARRRFLEMWAVEHDYINPMLDRMAEDLRAVPVEAAEPPADDRDGGEPDDDEPRFQPPSSGAQN